MPDEKKNVTATLPTDFADVLKLIAAAEGRSVSAVAGEFIFDGIARYCGDENNLRKFRIHQSMATEQFQAAVDEIAKEEAERVEA